MIIPWSLQTVLKSMPGMPSVGWKKSNCTGFKSVRQFCRIWKGSGSFLIRASKFCPYFLLMRLSIIKNMTLQDGRGTVFLPGCLKKSIGIL